MVANLARLSVTHTKIKDRSWSADGLDDEELVILIALESVPWHQPQLFDELSGLFEVRHTLSRTIDLPSGKVVNLLAMQSDRFPANERLLRTMEEGINAVEAITGMSFPATDVILVVPIARPGVAHDFGLGRHLGSHNLATRYHVSHVSVRAVWYVIALYYFGGVINGPEWLVAGGAEFVAMYADHVYGSESLNSQIPNVLRSIELNCRSSDLDTISDLVNLRTVFPATGIPPDPDICHYRLGAYFMHELYETLGEASFSAALRDLRHVTYSGLPGDNEAEADIFHAFLANTPPELEDEFMAVYRRIHGGPCSDGQC